jgi:8-oxo-dGTP pyrophosphatase MutT (NUDIX family)
MADRPDWMITPGRPWQADEGRTVYENPWLTLTEYAAIAPTGRPALYGVVRFANRAIAILPLHEDASVTLVGQNRFVFGDYSWEIPEGGAPMDEDPLDGARRELAEETGLQAADWRQVLSVQMSNSVTNEVGVGYLAMGLSAAAEQAPDETEDLAVVRVPFRQALQLAVSGEIQDSLTVAMLLRAHHMAVSGDLPRELALNMIESPFLTVREP